MSRFRFIGKDRSLGYRTGRTYLLDVMPLVGSTNRLTYPPAELAIRRIGISCLFKGEGFCPYANWEKFYENWEAA